MSQALWPFMSDSFQCFTSSCETVKLDLGWKQKILRVNDWQFVVIYRRNWLVVLYATNKSIQRNCSLNYPEGSHLTTCCFATRRILQLGGKLAFIWKSRCSATPTQIFGDNEGQHSEGFLSCSKAFQFHFDKHLFSLGWLKHHAMSFKFWTKNQFLFWSK